MTTSRELGAAGEAAAAVYLARCGMQVVVRNWRCRLGEIDIVARDGAVLVFCEVKTRRSVGFGHPLEAITVAKQARLRRLAGQYLAETGSSAAAVRIDAVGILWHGENRLDLVHLRGVA